MKRKSSDDFLISQGRLRHAGIVLKIHAHGDVDEGFNEQELGHKRYRRDKGLTYRECSLTSVSKSH